jgi:hypothetical protein
MDSAIWQGELGGRVLSNPLGRVHDAVWHIAAGGERGNSHTAPIPEELARSGLVLGATTPRNAAPGNRARFLSAVAKKMGLKSIYIDSTFYRAEAQQRVLAAQPAQGAANDNLPSAMRAGD